MKDHTIITQHAFGIRRTKHQEIIESFVESEFTLERKVCSDKGRTIFNCEKKRKWAFTAFKTFKKRRTKEFRETTSRIPIETLKTEYENLPESEKLAYQILADRDLERAEHQWDELKEVLVKCKGKSDIRDCPIILDVLWDPIQLAVG